MGCCTSADNIRVPVVNEKRHNESLALVSEMREFVNSNIRKIETEEERLTTEFNQTIANLEKNRASPDQILNEAFRYRKAMEKIWESMRKFKKDEAQVVFCETVLEGMSRTLEDQKKYNLRNTRSMNYYPHSQVFLHKVNDLTSSNIEEATVVWT